MVEANDGLSDPTSRAGRIDFFRFAAVPGVEVMDVHRVSRKWAMFHEAYTFCVASWGAG
jgi:hypothetical protein